MHVLWGILMMAAGLFMVVCASLKSQFIIYRLMVARSKILWGENVHRFLQITGIVIIVFGALVAFALVGCSKREKSNEVQDINSVRANLREQVASGRLTREEAIVRLAEATRDAKLGSGGKGEGEEGIEFSPALEELSKELKERVTKGELTTEEAKTAWEEAAKKAKNGSDSKEIKDSTKGTK